VARVLTLLFLLASTLQAEATGKVIAVNVNGIVHPITVEILTHALEQAKEENAPLLLVRLNTPGGLMEATRTLCEKLTNAPIPVVTYVTPSGGRAASAGFFVLMAGDVAAMAPGTNTGAASPILLGQQMDPVLRKKLESDTAAWLRSLVGRRGRNAEMAEKTVLDAQSFTENEALEHRLIELIAASDADLLSKLDGREITRFDGSKTTLALAGAQIADYQLKFRERLMSALADPNISFLLLVLGVLGLYIEFSAPGTILPGVAGAILLLLALSALSVLPIYWGGVALLVLAIVMFVLETQFASHGVLGVGGAVAMVLGAIMLIEGPPEVRIRLATAIAVTLPFALITFFLVSLVIRARRHKVMTGSAGLVGEIGIARTPLEPLGKIFVHGEYWDAVSTVAAPEGTRVRVLAVEGLRLQVEPADSNTGG
jgi:membrane-bound serine protease (ClpP class)